MKNGFLFFLSYFVCITQAQTLDSIATVESQNYQVTDTTTTETTWMKFKYDARNGANAFLYTFKRPLSWNKKDFTFLGATLLGTGITLLTDQQTSDFFRRQNNDIEPVVSEIGFWFGKPQVNYGITGSIYAVGLLTNNEKIRHTGILLIASASVSGLIQQSVKTIAGRARPAAELGPHYYEPFNGTPSFSSFPSGHTALSVTTCYALAKQFDNPWIKGSFYVAGMVSPLSRIWKGAHWSSDVFLSTAMSIAIVEAVDSYLKQDNKYNLQQQQPNKISWRLNFGYNQLGLVGIF